MVEFGLVLPLLLVLFLGIADFGRVFHAGIVAEAAARNAAEIVAEEYRRNPPGTSLSDPAPTPGDPAYYGPLHELGGLTASSEMRSLPTTTYDSVSRQCHIADADPATHDWMPVVMICIHDNADPLCDDPAFGATIPDPSAHRCWSLSRTPWRAEPRTAGTLKFVSAISSPLWSTSRSCPWATFGSRRIARSRSLITLYPPVASSPAFATRSGAASLRGAVAIRVRVPDPDAVGVAAGKLRADPTGGDARSNAAANA